jgi:hypothetical protein
MCEVWKWIMIGTGVPLLALRLVFGYPPFIYGPAARWKFIVPGSRFIWPWLLAVFVFFFALIVYTTHCG